jgi:hypothetical protein
MVKVIANDAVSDLLANVEETAEIRNSRGEVVGYFAPAQNEEAWIRAQVIANYDPEEAKRRRNQIEEVFTTEQVLDKLRSLGDRR